MRRVLAIGLAILVVMIAARGAMAQDSESATDRLLEILKDRQIISSDEYGELKTLAESMQNDQAAVDRKLTDLDRSISDYLAKSGDGVGANVSYMKGAGFGFATGNGLFALNIGGLFQFVYKGMDADDGYQDTNSFDVEENRFIFQGHAFDPNLTFYIEFDADSSVSLLDAYVDYNLCDWTNIRAGSFKVTQGRQNMTHESDRAFAGRGMTSSIFNLDRDTGLAFHDVLNIQEGGDAAFEYMVGFWNGEGRNSSMNDNNWLAWGLRGVVYPFGVLPYAEGDWIGDDQIRAGMGGSYFTHKNVADTKFKQWSLDGVMTWMGLFLMGEYFDAETDPEGSSSTDWDGWYVQAGYFLMPGQLEFIARYGKTDYDADSGLDEMKEWAFGLVYYFDGHHWKMGFDFGKSEADYKSERMLSYSSSSYDEDEEYYWLRVWFQLEW